MQFYLLYYIPIALQLLAAFGLYVGGPWVYIAIGSFPVLMVIDSVMPRDLSVRKMRSRFWAVVPVWIATLLGPILYLFLAFRIGQGDLSGWSMAGAILGVAWLSVVPIVPTAHELYHQRNPFATFVAHWAQVCYLDCTRDIAHVMGHHLDVATVEDSDTAPRGADLYSFTGKALVASTLCSFRTECDALERRGKGRWSLGHRVYGAATAQITMQTAAYLIGGWTAVAGCLTAMFVARCWAESFNYFQHYGLVRVVGSPIARRHVWNHLHPLSRIFGWEITNHADHHMDAYKPYYDLVPDASAVKMPSVFICFATALIPPLWQNLIAKPALREWDLTKANAEERKLARAQNAAAGWPDWFDESDAKQASFAH